MDATLPNMDKTYSWFHRLASWIERNPLPPIPFSDFSSWGQFHNPPAPHLEISYMMRGGAKDFRVGDMYADFPPETVALHNVHFGNYSTRVKGSSGWCLFLDVEGIEEFVCMKKAPFFVSMPVLNPKRLALAFQTVATRCRIPGMIHPGYLTGTKAYDPGDESHTTPPRQLHIKAAVLELLAILLENAQSLRSGPTSEQTQMITLAIEFITENFSRPDLTLDDIAESVNLSDDYFGMLFRQHVGTTPMRYLKTVRIEQSRLLLQKTDLTIGQVAQRVGFKDPLHFSRVFRNETRTSPRKYRQLLS